MDEAVHERRRKRWQYVQLVVLLTLALPLLAFGLLLITGWADLGVDLTVHESRIAARHWPFTLEQRPSFRDLYVRTAGFQEVRRWIAVTGDPADIRWLFTRVAEDNHMIAVELTAERVQGINLALQQADADFRAHGWDFAPTSGERAVISTDHRAVLCADQGWTRIHYHSAGQ